MTKRILALAVGILMVTGIAIEMSKRAHQAAHSRIEEILQAHNVSLESGAFMAEARRVMYGPVASADETPRAFESDVTVAYNGIAFIHDQVNAGGMLKQIDLLENEKVYCTEITGGKRTKTAAQLGEGDYQGTRFRVMTFGLVPILKQLHEPSVEVVHREALEGNQERLTVRTDSDTWTVTVDQERLIRKIERLRNRHDLAIEYSDYRMIDGARLPFAEKIFIDSRLTYELTFARIELNPSFPDDYFSRTALARIGAR